MLCNLVSSTSYFFLSNNIFFWLLITSTSFVLSNSSFCNSDISISNLLILTLYSTCFISSLLLDVDISNISLFNFSIFSLSNLYLKFKLVISLVIKETSIFSNSSFNSLNIIALSLWSFSGLTCTSNSLIISLTRAKLSLVFSNFLKASSFLFLYLSTPAASSKITLLSDGLLSITSLTFPCEIILKDSLAI